MFWNSINKYNSRSSEASKLIEELIQLAKDLNEEHRRGKELGLNSDKIDFYDALTSHETEKEVIGNKNLRAIAHELTKIVKENMTVDCDKKSSSRVNKRRSVKRLMKKYGYPPDLETIAINQVV